MDRARVIAEERQNGLAISSSPRQSKVSLDNLFETMKAADTKTINLIIKGDVQGSVETLAKTVNDQNTSEVRVRVIHSAVGPITESDVRTGRCIQGGHHRLPCGSRRFGPRHGRAAASGDSPLPRHL